MQTLPKEIEQLFHYLQNGTSAFHVIAHTKQVLTEAGFTELHIKDNWTLTKGGRYFCSPLIQPSTLLQLVNPVTFPMAFTLPVPTQISRPSKLNQIRNFFPMATCS